MKIVIHGGFFSESSQSDETKLKKQTALKTIIGKGFEFLKTHTPWKPLFIQPLYWKIALYLMQELVRKYKETEKSA